MASPATRSGCEQATAVAEAGQRVGVELALEAAAGGAECGQAGDEEEEPETEQQPGDEVDAVEVGRRRGRAHRDQQPVVGVDRAGVVALVSDHVSGDRSGGPGAGDVLGSHEPAVVRVAERCPGALGLGAHEDAAGGPVDQADLVAVAGAGHRPPQALHGQLEVDDRALALAGGDGRGVAEHPLPGIAGHVGLGVEDLADLAVERAGEERRLLLVGREVAGRGDLATHGPGDLGARLVDDTGLADRVGVDGLQERERLGDVAGRLAIAADLVPARARLAEEALEGRLVGGQQESRC